MPMDTSVLAPLRRFRKAPLALSKTLWILSCDVSRAVRGQDTAVHILSINYLNRPSRRNPGANFTTQRGGVRLQNFIDRREFANHN
jgi:hypothetical protein